MHHPLVRLHSAKQNLLIRHELERTTDNAIQFLDMLFDKIIDLTVKSMITFSMSLMHQKYF